MTSTPTLIVAYLALFGTVAFLFIFAALLLGWLLRIKNPTTEKLAVYECGEPAVGSGFVQFDLRFYVVALLFIIFDVEVAFFFPWATVFGKATQLMDPSFPAVVAAAEADLDPGEVLPFDDESTREFEQKYHELFGAGSAVPKRSEAEKVSVEEIWEIRSDARLLARTAIIDIGVFFAVLLVGFAYVWRQGDLNWVRAFDDPLEGKPRAPDAEFQTRPVRGAKDEATVDGR
jgi:NADH-quinone oxidoreductase subunit A